MDEGGVLKKTADDRNSIVQMLHDMTNYDGCCTEVKCMSGRRQKGMEIQCYDVRNLLIGRKMMMMMMMMMITMMIMCFRPITIVLNYCN